MLFPVIKLRSSYFAYEAFGLHALVDLVLFLTLSTKGVDEDSEDDAHDAGLDDYEP